MVKGDSAQLVEGDDHLRRRLCGVRSLISRSGQDTNAVAGSIEPADEKLKGVYISREVVTDHESRDAASDTIRYDALPAMQRPPNFINFRFESSQILDSNYKTKVKQTIFYL